MIFCSYKWIVFFLFLVTFPTESKNNVFLKKNSAKNIQNFFLIKLVLKKKHLKNTTII